MAKSSMIRDEWTRTVESLLSPSATMIESRDRSTKRRSTSTTTTIKATTIETRSVRQHNHRVVGTAALAFLIATGCRPDDSNVVRGRGLTELTLSAAARANIYEAAARAAFDVTDPALSLLLDRRELPRTTGLEPAGQISEGVVAEALKRGVFKGTCEPSLTGTKGTARCKAALPGYVLRFSPVFAERGDTAEVYMYAQRYDTPASGISETLRFERAYLVVNTADGWRAAREGRVPKEIRGEKK